jgi:hypothetical protein
MAIKSGNATLTFSVPLTVTASSAYVAGNTVDGLKSITGLTSANRSGLIKKVVLTDTLGQLAGVPVDVIFFTSNPTASTFADKTALAVNAADAAKVSGVVHLTDSTLLGASAPSMLENDTVIKPFVTLADTLWFVVVLRAAPLANWASTGPLNIKLDILQD